MSGTFGTFGTFGESECTYLKSVDRHHRSSQRRPPICRRVKKRRHTKYKNWQHHHDSLALDERFAIRIATSVSDPSQVPSLGATWCITRRDRSRCNEDVDIRERSRHVRDRQRTAVAADARASLALVVNESSQHVVRRLHITARLGRPSRSQVTGYSGYSGGRFPHGVFPGGEVGKWESGKVGKWESERRRKGATDRRACPFDEERSLASHALFRLASWTCARLRMYDGDDGDPDGAHASASSSSFAATWSIDMRC